MLKLIKSPWENIFLQYLKKARRNVYLASPFIKRQTASLIAQNVKDGIDFRYINCFKLAHFHTGVSDLSALCILEDKQCHQKNVHNLHAKFFVFDDFAIITSGNLTPGGLRNNLEYGVLIEGKPVEEIKEYYLGIFENPEYPEITLKIIKKAENILSAIPSEKRKTIKIADKALFGEFINDINIEERFDGGTASIMSNFSPWERDVFGCLEKIDSDVFTLQQVYSFEKHLGRLHPNNRHIEAKIRQQLQYLRKLGLLEFARPGIYKKLWS